MSDKLLIQPGTWYAEFDESGNCTSIYYAESFRRLLGFDGDEFSHENTTWMNSIHPEDKERAIRELNKCVSEMSSQADYDIEYRMMTKNGYRWFHDYAHCVRRADGTGTRCDGVIFDIDDAVKQQKSLAAHRMLLDYFVDQYWSACFIDLENDTLEIIRANNANTSAYIMDGTHEDMQRFIDTHFHPDDIPLMYRITDKEFVKRELRDKASVSYIAREIINGQEKTMRILIVRGSDENHVAVGFMDVTEEVMEQQKRLLGAVPLSNDILTKANIGLWAFELDEGHSPRMYADEAMLGLLGLAHQAPPEEIYHAWYDHIDEGSYELVTDAVAKMSSGEHAEVQYPWHHPNGDTWIVRCGGVRNFEYTKGIRIEGTHQNVTAVLHFDEEQQKQREKEIIEPFIAQYGIVCRVDLNDASYEELKFEDGGAGFRTDFENFRDVTDYFAENVVYPSDREILRREADTETIRARLKQEPVYSVEYRAVLDGTAIWHEMVISALSETEVVIGFRKNDSEILNRHVSKSLINNYDAIYIVNLTTDQMKVLKASGIMTDKPTVVPFSSTIREFAAGLQDEAKAYFESVADISREQTVLKKYGKAEYAYLSPYYGGESVWLKSEIHVLTWAEGEPETAVIGISKVDSLQREKIELDARLKESLSFTNFFLDTYVSAYYVDLNDLSTQVYKRTVRLDAEYPVDTDFVTSLGEYIARDVHPDDRAKLKEITRPDNLRRALALQPEITYVFRDMSGGTEKTYRFQAIRGADEDHVAFGFVDITEEINERKRTLQEAEETKRLVENVANEFDVAFMVNMTDDSLKPLKLDKHVSERIGADQFRSFEELRDGIAPFVHFTDRERLFKEFDYGLIRQKLSGRSGYSVEGRVVADGVTSWYEMSVTRINENEFAIGFAEKDLEITKRRLEEKRYDEYFALFVVDMDTERLKVEKNEERYRVCEVGCSTPYTPFILGMSEALEGEGKDFFLHIADLAYVKKELASDDKRSFAYKSIKLTGDKWIDVTTYCILRHEDGTPAMFTLGFSMVDALGTAREELRVKLKQQQEELEKALSQAESASRAKTEFLFNMSHDVRTPMNAILGFTNMAEKHIDDKEKVMDCLEKTKQSGNLLLSLINGVLDMSRIEHGSAELDEKAGDVYQSFASIESTLREEAARKEISLCFSFGEITDRYVYADFTRCLRVFTNLITNSIKYTKEGGYINVRCEQDGPKKDGCATFRYTVEDNGIGMSEEFQQRMFESFTREKNSTTSGIQGTGLGLSVCKSFVQYMGGTIECRSQLGKGTLFTVMLPFRVREDEGCAETLTGETPAVPAQIAGREIDFSGRRVLLVEDNELNREIAIELLEEKGLVVEKADDGSEAVDRLKRVGPDYYDFILMDIQMPVMNGYEATKAIRAMYPEARLPIIALSANAFAEDKAASLAAGMDDHVAKPIDVAELFGALARSL